jgi:uncharacterized membrane protein
MDANTQLLFHWVPILLGLLLLIPSTAESVSKLFVKKWPSVSTRRGQLLASTVMFLIGGFTVSAHTLWIHNKASELGSGNFCAGDGVWDCSSVIGNAEWNVDPMLGLPWGLLGMLTFSVMLWLIVSICLDPMASWVRNHLTYLRIIGVIGVFVIFYLIYAEFAIGKLCQYCSTAHFAHVMTLLNSQLLLTIYDNRKWSNANADDVSNDEVRERKRKKGYVKPKSSAMNAPYEEE